MKQNYIELCTTVGDGTLKLIIEETPIKRMNY